MTYDYMMTFHYTRLDKPRADGVNVSLWPNQYIHATSDREALRNAIDYCTEHHLRLRGLYYLKPVPFTEMPEENRAEMRYICQPVGTRTGHGPWSDDFAAYTLAGARCLWPPTDLYPKGTFHWPNRSWNPWVLFGTRDADGTVTRFEGAP
jgi:hypothetical protein